MTRTRKLSGDYLIALVATVMILPCVASTQVNAAEDASKQAPREYTLPVLKESPLVDGDSSDKCWAAVKPLEDFYLLRSGGKTIDAAEARLARDDKWLYLAIKVKADDPESMQQTVYDHDLQVCADDSIEIFIDAAGDEKDYLHYMLSAFNVQSERRVVRKGFAKDFSWNYPWRTATKLTDEGWQAEVAIPLEAIRRNGGLDNLRMNICLNRIILDVNHMGAIVGSRSEHSSWALLKGGFHEPESFGLIKGLQNAKIEVPVLVSATGLNASSYQLDAKGNFCYTVSGKIQALSDTAGIVRVEVKDMPVDGKGETVSQDVKVDKTGYYPFEIRVPVKVFTGRTAELSVVDPETDEIIQAVELRDLSSLTLMSAESRLSYYTSEPEATILCRIGLPEEELKKMQLVALDKKGGEMAREKKVTALTFFPVPIEKLAEGDHEVRVDLVKGDETLVSDKVKLVKRAPKPGCEWKIDYHHMSVLDNGKLFFPYGVMFGFDSDWEHEYAMRDVAEMNFNMVIRWRRVAPEKAGEIYELGRKYGLKVFEFPMQWQWKKDQMPAMPEEIVKSDWKERRAWLVENIAPLCVDKVKDEPLLMGWYLWDEPGDSQPLAKAIDACNRKVYAADGYHPTEVLYIPPIPGGEFTKNCDMYGIDPYFVPGSGRGETGNPNRVGRQTWLARRRADKDRRILWVTPCAERFSGTWLRFIDGNEQRVQTYLALVNGAKGIIYFVYPFNNQQTAVAFTKLGAEMKTLGPACAHAEPPCEIVYDPPADRANGVYPDVQLAVKQHPDGRYFLIGANWKPYPVDVECSVSVLKNAKHLEPLFAEGERVAVKDGRFKIQVPVMSSVAYVLPAPANKTEPIKIQVNEKAVREKTNRFYTKEAIPKQGLVGTGNLFHDGSFEESDIPGSPNYVRHFYFYKWTKRTRVGDGMENPPYELDPKVAYHGKQSLKMDLSKIRCLRIAVFPGKDRSSPYTMSAWVKSDGKEKFVIRISPSKKAFEVTDKWTRISVPIEFPPQVPQWGDFMQFNLSQRQREEPLYLWLDAIQLEKGTEATEYKP